MSLWPKGRRIGFVPTMGFLHAGHLALVQRAKKENDAVVVSVFVNPTQFGPSEDFKAYPRNLKRDLAFLKKAGVDAVFVPKVTDIYPKGVRSTLKAGAVAKPLEGVFRPGHFDGVATVVKRLFDIVSPAKAYFGQKDCQQVLVVQDLVRRLKLPVKIVACPTVREMDGLAMSSRNTYLSPQERAIAPVLHQTLRQARRELKKGTNPREVEKIATTVLTLAGFSVQYVAVADAKTLKPASAKTRRTLILAAAYLGKTRLIDNVV
ncbi:MAG: pantoate--beta-alanine ligase [Candidatus Micrarchaeota archaeon]|nr:pantoate--beta-alanine ligase [Candidatus Micrarchaeota archaeon]